MFHAFPKKLTFAFLILLIVAGSFVTTALAERIVPIWQEPTASLVSSWAVSVPKFDGRISSELEWADAYAQKIDLYRPDWKSGNYYPDDKVQVVYFLKNDADWLYFLVHVNSTAGVPEETEFAYFWPVWHGTWPHSVLAGIDTSNHTREGYSWNEKDWQYGGTNVKGAASCTKWGAAGLYADCWFEYAKRLRSGDERDWQLSRGDILGGRPPDLVFNLYFAGGKGYQRYVKLYLSVQGGGSSGQNFTYSWGAGFVLSFNESYFSEDYRFELPEGLYRVVGFDIHASVNSMAPQSTVFVLGQVLGVAGPPRFSVSCTKEGYCSHSTNLKLSAIPFVTEGHYRGDVWFSVDYDNRTSAWGPSKVRPLHTEYVSYRENFIASTGMLHGALVAWSGDTSSEVQLTNVTLRMTVARTNSWLADFPDLIPDSVWERDFSFPDSPRVSVAALAVADSGRVLAGLLPFRPPTGGEECGGPGGYCGHRVFYLIDSGKTLWSYQYPISFPLEFFEVGMSDNGERIVLTNNVPNYAGVDAFAGNGTRLWHYTQNGARQSSMSADGSVIGSAACDRYCELDVFDGQGKMLWSKVSEQTTGSAVAVSGDGNTILSGGFYYYPKYPSIISVVSAFGRGGALLWDYRRGDSLIDSLASSMDASRLVVGYSDGSVVILDRNGNIVRDLLMSRGVADVTISHDGGIIAVACSDGSFYILDGSGRSLSKYSVGEPVMSVAISGNGKYLAVGTMSGKLRLYSVQAPVRTAVSYVEDLMSRIQASGVNLTESQESLSKADQLFSQNRWIAAYEQARTAVTEAVTEFPDVSNRIVKDTAVLLMNSSENWINTATQWNATQLLVKQIRNSYPGMDLFVENANSILSSAWTDLLEANQSIVHAHNELLFAQATLTVGDYLSAALLSRTARALLTGEVSQLMDAASSKITQAKLEAESAKTKTLYFYSYSVLGLSITLSLIILIARRKKARRTT